MRFRMAVALKKALFPTKVGKKVEGSWGGVERAYYHNCKQIGFSKMTQADVNKRLKKKKWQDICFFSIYYLK